MKKMGQIMSEMGFTKDAPQATKEAFIKHLIKAAYGVEVETPTEKQIKKEKVASEAQLSFDFDQDKKTG